MIEYDLAGNATTYYANWQNFTVGDNGIYIHQIFPGIDMTIKYSEATVKSNLIILHRRSGSSKIVFLDALNLPIGYSVKTYLGKSEPEGWQGNLTINDSHNQINIIDNSSNTLSWFGHYSLSGNTVGINVGSEVYDDSNAVFPIIVDPTITYGPYNSIPNPIGAGAAPAFCSNALVVSVPGGAMCTDFGATWSVTNQNKCGCSNGSCHFDHDQIYFTSSCGGVCPAGAPASVWTCTPGCNFYGTWNPTLPFGFGCTSMATCIPPSCSAQNITFSIFLNQWSCGLASCASCVYATNVCAHLDSWSVTIQAKTVLHANVPTSSAGTTICPGGCTNLLATGNYGVPPYTYLWMPGGGTTNPYNVCPPNGATTYTCNITDACGVTDVNSVTINATGCLPIELLSFEGNYNQNGQVILDWSTASESNNSYFSLERSHDGINFDFIGNIPSKAIGGNSVSTLNYSFTDTNPIMNFTSYYRLRQTDFNGQNKISGMVSVDVPAVTITGLSIKPNPASETVQIGFSSFTSGNTTITIVDYIGREVRNISVDSKEGANTFDISISDLNQGFYFVQVGSGGQVLNGKILRK
jgi:hypothetical protein